jgi:hypothetical protein
MNWYVIGCQDALEKLGIANTHPLMKGVKVDVDVEPFDPAKPIKPEKAPAARIWPPPRVPPFSFLFGPACAGPSASTPGLA